MKVHDPNSPEILANNVANLMLAAIQDNLKTASREIFRMLKSGEVDCARINELQDLMHNMMSRMPSLANEFQLLHHGVTPTDAINKVLPSGKVRDTWAETEKALLMFCSVSLADSKNIDWVTLTDGLFFPEIEQSESPAEEAEEFGIE